MEHLQVRRYFLGDKGFCSYYDQSSLKDIGVDSIITLARRMPVSEAVKVLDENDFLIRWKKPVRSKLSSYSQEDWKSLPETLLLRQIKMIVRDCKLDCVSAYIPLGDKPDETIRNRSLRPQSGERH